MMEQKYQSLLVSFFDLPEFREDRCNEELANADSLLRFQLITELEDSFSVAFSRTDILEFTTYQKGYEILRQKLGE